jgi:hypothetical protein
MKDDELILDFSPTPSRFRTIKEPQTNPPLPAPLLDWLLRLAPRLIADEGRLPADTPGKAGG